MQIQTAAESKSEVTSGDTPLRKCPFCSKRFVPRKGGRAQIYCSVNCRCLATGRTLPRKQGAPVSPFNRSSVTNGRRSHQIGKVDGRTLHARRWRDLFLSFQNELGHPPSAADEALLRSAADLQLEAETLSAQIAAGQTFDFDEFDQLQRLNGALRRTLVALGLANNKGALEPEGAGLSDLLARKSA